MRGYILWCAMSGGKGGGAWAAARCIVRARPVHALTTGSGRVGVRLAVLVHLGRLRWASLRAREKVSGFIVGNAGARQGDWGALNRASFRGSHATVLLKLSKRARARGVMAPLPPATQRATAKEKPIKREAGRIVPHPNFFFFAQK